MLNPQQIIDFLADKWQGKACPMCGVEDWGITGEQFELKEHRPATIGKVHTLPMVPVFCNHCGNTIFINAVIAGFREDRKVS